MINWLKKFEKTELIDKILVHCFAGASRSAGVAKYIAEKYDLKFNYEYNDYNELVYNILLENDKKCLKEQLEDITKKD
ncbi:MAG: dual specificity protein phosphatase family protein [Proteobacteria bacterium]|nr:dual specificity protein phosphatase family protein [Pseudomonadota bacterium]